MQLAHCFQGLSTRGEVHHKALYLLLELLHVAIATLGVVFLKQLLVLHEARGCTLSFQQIEHTPYLIHKSHGIISNLALTCRCQLYGDTHLFFQNLPIDHSAKASLPPPALIHELYKDHASIVDRVLGTLSKKTRLPDGSDERDRVCPYMMILHLFAL
jgi:hypothetical protein